jgi:hypothetical protein
MRITLNILGILFLLTGGLWLLQGIGMVGGSNMSGQTKWAGYGAILFAIGVVALLLANRRRVSS